LQKAIAFGNTPAFPMRIGTAIKINRKEDMEMTSFRKNTWMVAATLVVAAGTASAQTLTAEIPFAFRTGSAMMAPGTYTVIRPGGMTRGKPGIYKSWLMNS
jgi:hypothetical protein